MNKQGFTLIEVLIAGSLFIVCCLSFSFVIGTNKAYLQRAKELNQARLTLHNSAEAVWQESTDKELEQIKIADNIYILRSKY